MIGHAGWSFQKKGLQTRREGNVTIYGIPYSEHSSFAELRNCVKLLRPKRLIPTVNCPDAASARAIVDRFADLMDLSRDKSRLDCYFGRTASAPARSLAASSLSAGASRHDQDCKTESDCLASPQLSAELLQSSSQSHSGSADDGDSKDAVAGIVHSDGAGLQAGRCQGRQHWPIMKLENAQAWSLNSDQVKREDNQAIHAQGWADDDHFDGNSPLPVRSRAGPQYAMPSQQGRAGPSHAYSAPAALEHDTAVELDDGHQTDFLSQPVTPASCQRPAWSSAGLHESVSPQAETDACCVEVQQHLSHRPCIAPGDTRDTERVQKPGCGQDTYQQTIKDISQPVLVANDTPVCLLDDIDVAEQTRILSQIHQEALHARQCLPTKKRQLTLGNFVGPKRVK